MREGLNSAEVRAEIINVLNVYLLFFLSLYPPLKLPKKQRNVWRWEGCSALPFIPTRAAGWFITGDCTGVYANIAISWRQKWLFYISAHAPAQQQSVLYHYNLFIVCVTWPHHGPVTQWPCKWPEPGYQTLDVAGGEKRVIWYLTTSSITIINRGIAEIAQATTLSSLYVKRANETL